MLLKYTNSSNLLESDEVSKLKYAEIIANHLTKKIYFKNIDSRLVKLNPGISKLIEATEFEFTKSQIKYNNTLLKFNKDYQLLTKLVFFNLSDLEGINIAIKNTENNYLGFEEGILVNLDKPSFEIVDLSDIVSNINLSKDTDKYKLAFIYSNTLLNPKNDYFYKSTYGYWTVLPEATNLKDFNDVLVEDIDYERQAYTLRVVTKSQRESTVQGNKFGGKRLEIIPLDISWDKTPQVAGNLNSNNHNIKNISYKTKYKTLFNTVETLDIDFLTKTNYVAENISNCITINLNFLTSNLSNGLSYYASVNIINFKGFINFANDNPNITVLFENGELPSLITDNFILTLTATKLNGIVSIVVGQKINYGN